MTESYSASSDPPQPVTPVCLLHQFPHTIEHCMQWSREVLFEGYFVKDAEIVNNWLENEHFIKVIQSLYSPRKEKTNQWKIKTHSSSI